MAGKKPPNHVPAFEWPKALREFKSQLAALERMKGRRHDEVEAEESEWRTYTENLIENMFGPESTNLTAFTSACWAGSHNMFGVSPNQEQANFEERIREFESLLKSIVREIQLRLPDEAIQGVYDPGDEYKFYRDLSGLFAASTKDVFLIDGYLSEEVFNLYVEKIPAGTHVRILTNRIAPNVEAVARKFASARQLNVRNTKDIHDRVVFLDHRCWVIGQSIKDAATKKPTYMVELEDPLLTPARNVYENLWSNAGTII